MTDRPFYLGDEVEFFLCEGCRLDGTPDRGEIVAVAAEDIPRPYVIQYVVGGKTYTDSFREDELTRVG